MKVGIDILIVFIWHIVYKERYCVTGVVLAIRTRGQKVLHLGECCSGEEEV
jgi:hypothetical protein